MRFLFSLPLRCRSLTVVRVIESSQYRCTPLPSWLPLPNPLTQKTWRLPLMRARCESQWARIAALVLKVQHHSDEGYIFIEEMGRPLPRRRKSSPTCVRLSLCVCAPLVLWTVEGGWHPSCFWQLGGSGSNPAVLIKEQNHLYTHPLMKHWQGVCEGGRTGRDRTGHSLADVCWSTGVPEPNSQRQVRFTNHELPFLL